MATRPVSVTFSQRAREWSPLLYFTRFPLDFQWSVILFVVRPLLAYHSVKTRSPGLGCSERRTHQPILNLSFGEDDFPTAPVRYHRACRKDFVNQKSLKALSGADPSEGDVGGDSTERRPEARVTQVLQYFLIIACFARRRNTNLCQRWKN